jgi:hypothetical protein
MNKVLAAERMAQAQLIDARTKAQTQQIEAQSMAQTQAIQVQARIEAERQAAQSQAEMQRVKVESEIASLRQRESAAGAFAAHPALLRLLELETLRELGRSANARIYVNFQRPAPDGASGETENA